MTPTNPYTATKEDLKTEKNNAQIKVLDSAYRGFQVERPNLPWEWNKLVAGIDPDLILAQDPEDLEAFSIQEAYVLLKKASDATKQELLPLLSTEQLQGIIDYDCWDNDRLNAKLVLSWIGCFEAIEPGLAFKRYETLEEELQIATLAPFIRIFDHEEYEKLTQEEQDLLYRLPGDAFFFGIESSDMDIHNGIEMLVESGFRCGRVEQILSVLAHASYLPPNESELQLLQFRKARLEEDGFVTYEESQKYFIPKLIHPQKLEGLKANTNIPFLTSVLNTNKSRPTDLEAWQEMQRGLLGLLNALCSANFIEADDTQGQSLLFDQLQAVISLGLEDLAGGDPLKGFDLLLSLHPTEIFGHSLGIISQVRHSTLDKYVELQEVAKLIDELRFGVALEKLNTLGHFNFEEKEVLRSFCSRLPKYPKLVGPDSFLFCPVSSLYELYDLNQTVNKILSSERTLSFIGATDA